MQRYIKLFFIAAAAAVIISAIYLITPGDIMSFITPSFTPSFGGDSHKVLTGQPDCGWYNLGGYCLGDDYSESDLQMNLNWDDETDVTTDLVEINLKAYSDRDLDEKALSQLDHILSEYRNRKHSVILRPLYDWEGKSALTEPSSVDQVYSHIDSLATVINRYKDTVFVIQGVFLGDVGEMHGSAIFTNKLMTDIIKYLYEKTDPSIYLAVRTPAQLRFITGSKEPLSLSDAFSGSLRSRLGLFNDGFLGSQDDLGTYGSSDKVRAKDLLTQWKRSDETDFQNTLSRFVISGGETGADPDHPSSLSDLPQALDEIKKIHISYLNRGYSETVINKWKNTQVTLPDGSTTTDGSTAVGMYLGVRPEVTDVAINLDGFLLSHTDVSVTIKNSGSAPLYRSATARLTVTSESGETYEVSEPVDLKALASDDSVTETFSLKTRSLKAGTYSLHLSLESDASGRPVLLSNSGADADGLSLGTLEKR